MGLGGLYDCTETKWDDHKDWSLSYVKTPIEVLDRIVHAVSMGGNMVVNFGPQADGDFVRKKKLWRLLSANG